MPHVRKKHRTSASPATDAFLSATADALADASTAPEAEREAVWTRLSEDALALITPGTPRRRSARWRCAPSASWRAPAAVGGFGASGFDPDAMLAHRALDLLDHSFSDGSNDFDRRYEAMERQTAVLGAYADLLVARGAGARAATALASLARVARWAWEHYFVAGERARGTRARLAEAFEALAFRGDHHAHGRARIHLGSLVALSLRSPPDPIDSAAFRAALGSGQVRGPVDAADARRRRRAESTDARVCDVRPFVRETLQLCQTLQLRVVPAASEARGDDEHRDEDRATTRSRRARRGRRRGEPRSMQTFLCLVDLFCAVIAGAPARHPAMAHDAHRASPRSLPRTRCCRASTKSRASRSSPPTTPESSNRQTPFTPTFDPRSTRSRRRRRAARSCWTCSPAPSVCPMSCARRRCSCCCRRRQACCRRELAPALRDALAVGAHPPLAHAALDVLDRWTGTRGTLARSSGTHDTQNGSHRRESTRHRAPDREEIRALLPSMARSLRAYVDRRGASEKTDAGGDASFDAENLASGLNAGDAYRSAPRRRSARAAGRSAEPSTTSTRASRACSARWAARRTPSSTTTIGARVRPARRRRRRRRSGTSSGASRWTLVGENARVTIWLDRMLPRAAHCALSSTDRAAKVAAAEFLHAATLLMVGRNARAFAPEGGTMRGKPRRSTRSTGGCSRRCWSWRSTRSPCAGSSSPRSPRSSCGGSPGARRAKPQKPWRCWTPSWRASPATPRAATPGGDRSLVSKNRVSRDASRRKLSGGAAARRRDLCASLAAECLKWSVRSVPSGDLRGGARRAEARGCRARRRGRAVGRRERLVAAPAALRVPDAPRPVQAAGRGGGLRLCLAELGMFPEHDEAHALEILETALRSLRLADRDPPGAGAAEAGALLARAATRACARHARRALPGPEGQSVRRRAAARSGRSGVWFPGSSRTASRSETRARLESQLAFGALVQRTPGYVSPRAWVARRARGGRRAGESQEPGRGSDGGDSDDRTRTADPGRFG